MALQAGNNSQQTARSFMSRPIRTILLAGFLLVALVPVVFLGFKLYQVAWEEAWREITEKHQLLAQNLATPLSIYVDDQRSSLGQMADMVSYVAGQTPNLNLDSGQINALTRSMNKLDGFKSISLVNLNGRVLLSTRGQLAENQRAVFEYETCYVNARKQNRWFLSGVKPSPFDKQPSLIMSMPVYDAEHHQSAILMAELRTDLIEKIRKQIKFGEKGHSAIVDNKGRALAHPNPDWVREMRDLSSWPITQKMISGQTGVTEFYSPFMGADMVAGFASVPGINWGIMVPQPKPEVEAHVNRILHTQLVWGIIGLSLALLLAFLLTRWLTRPLNQLCQSASKICDDDFNGNLPELSRHAPREIRSLRERFVSLVRGLQASHAELDELNQSLQRRVNDATQELRGANRQLQVFASQDYLTKLYNRRYFESSLLQMISVTTGEPKHICLMMLDIDNFKPINERYGHAAGDRFLVQMARILQDATDEDSLVARYDGDQFMVLVENDQHKAEQLARRILSTISDTGFEWQGETVALTVSIGMFYQRIEPGSSLDTLLHGVDQALYKAREQGESTISMLGF